jgi:hypothetical protein
LNSFAEVRVLPNYGGDRAIIRWRLADNSIRGRFTVFKSPDGVNNWERLAEATDTEFVFDDRFFSQGKWFQWYYRVAWESGGETAQSNIVATFGDVRREEFGAARVVMNQAYQQLRRFTRIGICKLRVTAGACAVCVDRETGQQVGISLCQNCYGTGLDGGYFPAVASHMKIGENSDVVQIDSPEGAGARDMIRVKSSMLAFPFLRKDDLVVDPKSDRRYLVETISNGMLIGKIPVLSTVSMLLLRSQDVRYKFPVN